MKWAHECNDCRIEMSDYTADRLGGHEDSFRGSAYLLFVQGNLHELLSSSQRRRKPHPPFRRLQSEIASAFYAKQDFRVGVKAVGDMSAMIWKNACHEGSLTWRDNARDALYGQLHDTNDLTHWSLG